ncbi:MAG: hypothetical protein IPO05_03645 [Flavobacteriales bacterium]|nr:hypothetical protein [Flavobacteriales bacterium]
MKTVELTFGNEGSGGWTPIEGEETNQLISHIGKKWSESERENLRKSTTHILSQCSPPHGPGGRRTGLVVGYVQSGKTASFTAVTAMAADNGYPLIIVLTGTKNNLQKQSADRLEEDLQLKTRKKRKWRHLREPGKNEGTAIRQILEDYRDKDPDGHVALVVLKKHKAVLKKFMAALKGIDLNGVPVILIDDEADQASLNARVNQDEESPTYSQICQLRDLFDNHTFLEYTATPQANLLISVLDVLSPQFAEVIQPGGDYVGGVEFFRGESASLVRDIPVGELPVRKGPVGDVPPTLLEALRLYFLGVAAGYVTGDEGGNRTMFIHPSRETDLHGEFAFRTRQIMSRWAETLGFPQDDIDRLDLLDSFKKCYDDLHQTVGEELPTWDELQAHLRKAIRRASVDEVNSVKGSTEIINWGAQYARVIVGGQALDRGVTIEGLTVTYMPRGVGTGAADSLQQRARFLGYKRSYLGYCRLFLDASVKGAFNEYVEHEKSLRGELDKLRDTPVTSWRRVFILSPNLQPTRRNVLSLKHVQATCAHQWYWVRPLMYLLMHES